LGHILFAVPDEEVASAFDRYLESLEPLSSPKLESGRLSAAASRGELVFRSPETGCALRHTGILLTDLKRHDVGTTAVSIRERFALTRPRWWALANHPPYAKLKARSPEV
jgi:hypothetical protein